MTEAAFEAQDFLMNTPVEQKIHGADPFAIYSAALKKMNALEDKMSFYREGSEVSLINLNAGKTEVKTSKDLMEVLETSQKIMDLSCGSFNIMLAPVIQLWRTAGNQNKPPSKDDIKKALKLCKRKNLILNKRESTAYLKKPGCMIDLGGIGKGYVADACCRLYKKMDAASAFINIGGNVKTTGGRPDGHMWSVGLQHPDRKRGECFGAVMSAGNSVVTSGAYERYQEIHEVKYHHIIDGKTGWPSESDLKSVTVISKSSMKADALSTAAFVLGLEKGIDLVKASKGIDAVFFTETNEVYITKGLKKDFKLFKKLTCYEI